MTQADHEALAAHDTFLRAEAKVDVFSPSGIEEAPSDARDGQAQADPETLHSMQHPPFTAFDTDQAARIENWERFWVLAIKIDANGDAATDSRLHACIVEFLDQAENFHKSVWARWRDDIYLVALPKASHNLAMGMARKLQSGLAKQRVETLSIGISSFPLEDYSWRDSTLNACKALDHAAFFGPGAVTVFDAVSCNISGDKHYQNSRLDRAMAEYQAGLAMDPSNVNLLNSLGVCLANYNERNKAKAAFEAALKHDPNEAFAHYNLGVISVLDHNPDQALMHLKKAYALNKETFEIPFQIGKVFCDQGRYEPARQYLVAALDIRQDNAAVHRLIGKCHAATGNHPEALAAYRNAVKLNPNDAVALSALGALYAATDENPEICMAFLEQSVAIDPENGLFRHRLARFYQERDQLRQALQAYEKAVDLGHDSHRQVAELRSQIEDARRERKRCSG